MHTAKSRETRILIDIFTNSASSLDSAWNAATCAANRPNALTPETAISLFLENASRKESSKTSQEALLAYVSGEQSIIGEPIRSLHSALSCKKTAAKDIQDATAEISHSGLSRLDVAYLKDAANALAKRPASEAHGRALSGIESLVAYDEQETTPQQPRNSRAELARFLRNEADKSHDRFRILTNAYASFDSSQFIRQDVLSIGQTILAPEEWEDKFDLIAELLVASERQNLNNYEKNYLSEAIRYIDGNRRVKCNPQLRRVATSVAAMAAKMIGEKYAAYRASKESLTNLANHLDSTADISEFTIVGEDAQKLIAEYRNKKKATIEAAPIGEYFQTNGICEAIERNIRRIEKSERKKTAPELTLTFRKTPEPLLTRLKPNTLPRKIAYLAAAAVSAIVISVAAYATRGETTQAPVPMPEPAPIVAIIEQPPAPVDSSRNCSSAPQISNEEFCGNIFSRNKSIVRIRSQDLDEVVARCLAEEVARIDPSLGGRIIDRALKSVNNRPAQDTDIRVVLSDKGRQVYYNPMGPELAKVISKFFVLRHRNPFIQDDDIGIVICERDHFEAPTKEGRPGCFARHLGTDIVRADGTRTTKLYTIRPGRIIRISKDAGNAGNYIVVDHGDGTRSSYMHQDRFSPEFEELFATYGREGKSPRTTGTIMFPAGKGPIALPYIFSRYIGRDTYLGDMGATGNAKGGVPHLHEEIIAGNRHLDPEKFLPMGREEIPATPGRFASKERATPGKTPFSAEHERMLTAFALQFGVDPEMLQQLRLHEARSMESLSYTGAAGFMQMQENASRAALRVCSEYAKSRMYGVTPELCEEMTRKNIMTDPEINLASGALLFGDLLRKNGGDYLKAMTAYGRGQSVVDEAVEEAERSGGHWFDNLTSKTKHVVKARVPDRLETSYLRQD